MLAIEQYTRRLLRDFHPIVAANRPPVDLAPDPAERERFVRGAGGLVTGLSGLAQATGAVWVASVRDGFEGERALGARREAEGRRGAARVGGGGGSGGRGGSR